jgi:hypothetical protein
MVNDSAVGQWLLEREATFLNAVMYQTTLDLEFTVEKIGSEKLNTMPKRTVKSRTEI